MTLEQHDGVSLLRLDNGKANAMNLDLLKTIESGVGAFLGSDSGALVITGYDRFFSAGLDLPTLAAFDRLELQDFMRMFHRVMLGVFECPRPVVAAVNGHAVAGGCVLSLQADWRVLANGRFKYGCNETRLGIGLPPSAALPLLSQLPPASITRIALEGALVGPAEALRLGLVHELAPAEQVLDRALEKAAELATVPAIAYAQVKHSMRRSTVEEIRARGPADEEPWLDAWFGEEAQGYIQAAVDQLTAAKA
jgi:enoyl-CoA hydratase/carnithine racemase